MVFIHCVGLGVPLICHPLLPVLTELCPLASVAPFPPMLTKWEPGQPQCLPRGESVTFSVTVFNANRYDWLFNGVPVSPNTTYRIQVAPNTCGVYQCSVCNSHGCVWTPPIPISMSDEPTSSSITEASCETMYRVGVTPGPSTSVGECG